MPSHIHVIEAEEAVAFEEPEFAQSPDDLDKDIFPRELSTIESIEELAFVLSKFLLISSLFSLGSDMLAQHVEGKRLFVQRPSPPPPPPPTGVSDGDDMEHRAPYDWRRSARYMGTGTLFVGCAQFIRLGIIAQLFDPKDHTLATVLKKTAINQFIMSPLVNGAAMFTLTYIRFRDSGKAWEKLQADFCEAQLVAYTIKPLGNFCAFFFFPDNLTGQLVITRSVAFLYNTYFSVVAHRDEHPEAGEVEEWIEEDGEGLGSDGKSQKWWWNSLTHETRWTDPITGKCTQATPPPERTGETPLHSYRRADSPRWSQRSPSRRSKGSAFGSSRGTPLPPGAGDDMGLGSSIPDTPSHQRVRIRRACTVPWWPW